MAEDDLNKVFSYEEAAKLLGQALAGEFTMIESDILLEYLMQSTNQNTPVSVRDFWLYVKGTAEELLDRVNMELRDLDETGHKVVIERHQRAVKG
jgi:hypothetical protein